MTIHLSDFFLMTETDWGGDSEKNKEWTVPSEENEVRMVTIV